jgi:hypothetical protein
METLFSTIFQGVTAGGSGDTPNKGYFIDQTALETAYPVGEPGWYAILVSTGTIWEWNAGSVAWQDTGLQPPISSLPFTGSIYVDGALGNDTTGTGLLNAPYQTVQKALDVASTGNSIYLAEFDYAENLIVKCDVSIYPQGAARILGSISCAYNFYMENLPAISTSGPAFSTTGSQKTFQLVNCNLLTDDPTGAPALSVGSTQGSFLVKGGSLKTTNGSLGFGYLYADTDTKIILDGVDTDLGDNHGAHGIIVAEYVLLDILSGTRIDGTIYNPSGGITHIYGGATLLKNATANVPAIIAGTDNTSNEIYIYPGVICRVPAVSPHQPAFVGVDAFPNAIYYSSGGVVYEPGYNATQAFASNIQNGTPTILPTSSLQPAAQALNVTSSYTMLDSDSMVNYVGSSLYDVVQLWSPNSGIGRFCGVINSSSTITVAVEASLPNGYVTLMPNESAIFQNFGNAIYRVGGFNPAAIQNVFYVSKNGNDYGLGNITSPFLTVGAAINAAPANSLILIAPGTYTENIVLKNGVALVSMEGVNNNGVGTSTIILGNVSLASGGVQTFVSGLTLNCVTGDALTLDDLTDPFTIQFNQTQINNTSSGVNAGNGIYLNGASGSYLGFYDSNVSCLDVSTGKSAIYGTASDNTFIQASRTPILGNGYAGGGSGGAMTFDGATILRQDYDYFNGPIVLNGTSSYAGTNLACGAQGLGQSYDTYDCITVGSTASASLTNFIRYGGAAGTFIVNGTGSFKGVNLTADVATSSSLALSPTIPSTPLSPTYLTNNIIDYVSTDVDYTFLAQNFYVEATGAGGITITLLPAAQTKGQQIRYIKNSSALPITVDGANIDGSPTQTVAPGACLRLFSNGTQYLIS